MWQSLNRHMIYGSDQGKSQGLQQKLKIHHTYYTHVHMTNRACFTLTHSIVCVTKQWCQRKIRSRVYNGSQPLHKHMPEASQQYWLCSVNNMVMHLKSAKLLVFINYSAQPVWSAGEQLSLMQPSHIATTLAWQICNRVCLLCYTCCNTGVALPWGQHRGSCTP